MSDAHLDSPKLLFDADTREELNAFLYLYQTDLKEAQALVTETFVYVMQLSYMKGKKFFFYSDKLNAIRHFPFYTEALRPEGEHVGSLEIALSPKQIIFLMEASAPCQCITFSQAFRTALKLSLTLLDAEINPDPFFPIVYSGDEVTVIRPIVSFSRRTEELGYKLGRCRQTGAVYVLRGEEIVPKTALV
jgi:hypothetical protein